MYKKYTAIVRKSKLEYMAICMELNIAVHARSWPTLKKA